MIRESTRPAGPADVLAVVRSSGPLLIDGKPTALREICGAAAIRILADRLHKVPQIRRTVLVLDEAEPQTMAAAKRLGWSVALRTRPPRGGRRNAAPPGPMPPGGLLLPPIALRRSANDRLAAGGQRGRFRASAGRRRGIRPRW